MLNLSGSGVALVTPFNLDNTVNYEKLEELVMLHINSKTDYIVICGTTGEASTLSNEEKENIIKRTVKLCKGKIPVIVGTGSNDTNTAIKTSLKAKELGADGVLVVTPYYNKGNEEGLFKHFEKIANTISPLPLILYNVPSRTGVDLSVENIVKLSSIENIIGIKEASTSLEKIANIILKTRNCQFKVFSGNDSLTLPILSLGGSGVISVAANIIPNVMHDICLTQDKDLFYSYFKLMELLFIDVNPIMIKTAMNYLGYNVSNVRLPLYSTNENNIKILTNYLDKIKDELN